MYFARKFTEETSTDNKDATRWCNHEEDEEIEGELKKTMIEDESFASKLVLSSSTSESEAENEPEEGIQKYDNSQPEQDTDTLSEEEREKNRPGKVFILGASGNDYMSTVPPENHSSSDDSEQKKQYHLYITSFKTKNHPHVEITVEKFKTAIAGVVLQPQRIVQVRCGLLVTVNRATDVDKIIKINFPKILGGPIQIANISKSDAPYKKRVLFRTIPWVITLKEIRYCLVKQGIRYGKIKRVRNVVKVEVLNANHEERLLKEGLNFYNTVSFFAIPDIPNYNDRLKNKEIIQCYKCQGFWHTASNCKNDVKCVRCGEHHDVDKCSKPKTNPMCCNCHGAHHAAYKLCPTRLKMMSYINLKYRTVPRQPNFLLRTATS